MTHIRTLVIALVCGVLSGCATGGDVTERPWRGMGEVLAQSPPGHWRTIAPNNLLYMDLDSGTVVMELNPLFAPRHVDNLRRLLAAGFFDAAKIVRSQDNYVVQWSGDGALGDARQQLDAEFYRDASGLDFVRLDSRDAYATEVGFVDGFPVGRDDAGRAWLTHCYRMLGVGRDTDPGSGNAGELYVVTGHAPRHLDRNVTLIGRVIDGIENLTTLPRGTGPLGFFADEAQQIPVRAMRIGTDDDTRIEALRTDTRTFDDLVHARRYRNEDWFADPAGAIGLCNVPLPVRRVD